MASKSYTVQLNVVGNVDPAKAALTGLGDHSEKSAARMHSAFSSVLGTLNSSGVLGPFGDALSQVDGALDKIAGKGKTVGAAMLGIGGALAGVGMMASGLGSKEVEAQNQLKQAIDNTGQSYDDYKDRIDKTISSQEKLGNRTNQTQDAIRILTTATGDTGKALDMMGLAANLAAAKHEDLTSAAESLAKTVGGSTRLYKEFGITVEKASDSTKNLAAAQKSADTADQNAATAKQKLADLTARLEAGNKTLAVSTTGMTTAQDALAKAEQHLTDVKQLQAEKVAAGTALTTQDSIALRNATDAVTTATTKVTAAHTAHAAALVTAAQKAGLSVAQQQQLRDAQAKAYETTVLASEANTKLADTHVSVTTKAQATTDMMGQLSERLNGQASAAADSFGGKLRALKAEVEDGAAKFGQKYGPAITAAGAGMTLLGGVTETASGILSKFKTVKEVTTAATEAGTVATDAAAASEGLALGPILLIIAALVLLGVGIYELATHWQQVWHDVQDWTENAINFVKGLIGDVVNWIEGHWQLLLAILTGPFGLAVFFIKEHFNDIMSFIAGIPGDMLHISRDIGKALANGVIAGINAIIGAWDSLHFGIPTIDTHIPGIGKIGGGDFTVPQIPKIPSFDMGGIVPGPLGAPTLAIVHGGEEVTPVGGRSGGGGQMGGDVYLDSTVVGRVLWPAMRGHALRDTGRNAVRVGLS